MTKEGLWKIPGRERVRFGNLESHLFLACPGVFVMLRFFSQNFPPPLIFPQSTWCPFKCFTFYCKYQTGESYADYLHSELTPCLTWYTCILFFSSSKFDCLVWSAQTCNLFLQILVFLECLVDCLLSNRQCLCLFICPETEGNPRRISETPIALFSTFFLPYFSSIFHQWGTCMIFF